MVSKRFGPFCGGGARLFQHGEPQEAEHAPLSLVTSQKRPHLSPVFMLYAKNYNAIHFQRGERLISPPRNWPQKTLPPPHDPRVPHPVETQFFLPLPFLF